VLEGARPFRGTLPLICHPKRTWGRARQIYETVRARPGISVSGVAREVHVSPPAAHNTVTRLVGAGLIERRAEGREVHLVARDEAGPN
jgi:Mn-dependent DtxR family transcriptional regulator